jgi:NADPH:quinone reductase-like Zn-dependent oxidoreductase
VIGDALEGFESGLPLLEQGSEYPAKLSAVEGAALWMQYLTAYVASIGIAHPAKGNFLVIPAASSKVGIAAIGIARAEGAINLNCDDAQE